MKPLNRSISVLAVILLLGGCAEEKPYETETYYYIGLFGEDFPIPSRFKLIDWSKQDGLYFNSPLNAMMRADSEALRMPKIGSISIGPIDTIPIESIVLTLKVRCGFLDAHDLSYRDAKLQERLDELGSTQVLISGPSHFILIMDTDNQLWKKMLIEFARVADIPPGECDL